MSSVSRPHLGTSLERRPRGPRLAGEGKQWLWRNVGGVGKLEGVWRQVGRVMFAVLVQLAGSVAILWGVGSVGRGSSFDPHHDGLSLKQPLLSSQIPVGLHTR